MKTKIAVYGTLKQGWGNHRLLDKDPLYKGYVGVDRVAGHGFPIMKLGNKYKLLVEVYEVDDEELRRVDALEGYREGHTPHFYNRVLTYVTNIENGSVEQVFIYEYVSDVADNTNEICYETYPNILSWVGYN